MIHSQSLQPFLGSLSAGTATPGGGGAAAAAGAMGAALVCMVCNLTIGRRQYDAVEAELRVVLARAETLRAELTRLVDDDAAAFESVMAAYRQPKSSDDEIEARRRAIQEGTKRATQTALDTVRACAETIEVAQLVAGLGNPNALGEAVTGALCAQAGLKAASLNVRINLAAIDDKVFAATYQTNLAALVPAETVAEELVDKMRSQST